MRNIGAQVGGGTRSRDTSCFRPFFLVVSRNFLWGTLPGNFQNFALVPPYVFSKIFEQKHKGDPYDFFRFFQQIYKNTLVPPYGFSRRQARNFLFEILEGSQKN